MILAILAFKKPSKIGHFRGGAKSSLWNKNFIRKKIYFHKEEKKIS